MRLPKTQPKSAIRLISLIGPIGLILSFALHGRVLAQTASPSPTPAVAQLTVSPPSDSIDVKPGDTIQRTIKITAGDKALNLQASVSDYIVQDNNGTPIKVKANASGRYLASPWFTLEKTQISLEPKASTDVTLLISVPKDALPGGHYAGVFFTTVPGSGLKNIASYTAAEVGTLYRLNIAGDIKYDALIKEFKTNAPLYEFGPVDFTATIENQSDTHISPKVSIVVTDMIGRKLTELTPDAVNIFPFTSRTLTSRWETVWGLGRYTATLSAAYGPDGSVATRTIQFWIMPYRLIAAVLIVLLVLIALFIVIRRHIEHRLDTRDTEIESLKRKIVELENRRP